MQAIKAQVRKEAFAGIPAPQQRQIMKLLQQVRSNLVHGSEWEK
jgi:hypothetical protein